MGTVRGFVEKESIVIQLLWPFIYEQTKTQLILSLPIDYLYTSLSARFLFYIHAHTKMLPIQPSKPTCNTRLPRNTDKGTSEICTWTVTNECTLTQPTHGKIHTHTQAIRTASQGTHCLSRNPKLFPHTHKAFALNGHKDHGYGQAERLKGYEDTSVLGFGIRRPVTRVS